MAKIILKDGTEEYLSPGAAAAKVAAGEAVWGKGVPMYSTRQMVAKPVSEAVSEPPPMKKRRKRKPKVEKVEEETAKAEFDEAE